MRLRRAAIGDIAPAPSRLRRAVLAGSVFTVVALLTLVGFSLYRSYSETLANARVTTENLARMLEEHAVRTIHTVDQSLVAMAVLLAPRQGVAPFATAEIEAILRGQIAVGGEFRNLSVLNADGNVIYSSNSDDPKLNLADRSFFLSHRDNPSAGLVISESIVSRTGRGWFISLSRRLNDERGGFAGLISAAVGLDFFRNSIPPSISGRAAQRPCGMPTPSCSRAIR